MIGMLKNGLERWLGGGYDGRFKPAAPALAPPVAAPPVAAPLEGPLWVDLSPDLPLEQTHPIDLRWVDQLVDSARPHIMVRPEDELLILVPNNPIKLNRTALRVLEAMVEEGIGIAALLAREGDSPQRRRELHYFFSDVADWLNGRLGEGIGRKAVTHEPFTADFASYPVLAEVALTYRCNLSCHFCYAGCSAGGLPAGWREDRVLSDEQVMTVLERIRRDARCPSVSFTGGEPTLRPGLPRLVAHAKGLGMKVNLISNGQLLTDSKVDQLAAAGLDSVQLSLEGPTPAVHDRLVESPGAFRRLWASLERLRARGIRVHTNTTVNRQNLPHLLELVDLIARQGLERFTMNLVIPCGTAVAGGGCADELSIPYSTLGPTIEAIQRRAAERGVRFIWYSPLPFCHFNTAEHGLGASGCAAADGLLHVNPAGEVLPCSSFNHHESLGNLLHQPFDEIWQSRAARFFRAKEMMPAGCHDCSSNQICQGACPLYWRQVGLEELGGHACDRPPLPEGFEG